MPAPFPHRYRTTITRTLPSRASLAAGSLPALEVGPSPQFDGDATTWSPEQLLLSSLGSCLLTTFEAFAARDGIEIAAWTATANGEVERTPEGLQFTSIVLSIQMTVGGNVAKVEKSLEAAKDYCLVLTSMRVPVVVETRITTLDGVVLGEADDEPAQLAG